MPMPVCAPHATANDAQLERALADQRRRRLADAEPAVVRGNVEHQEAELAGLLEQASHHARRLRLDRVDVRQHLAAHEILGGGGDLLSPRVRGLRR